MTSEWVFIHYFLDMVSMADILRTKEGTLTPIGTFDSGTVKVSNRNCPDFTRPSPKTMGVYFFLFFPLPPLSSSHQINDIIKPGLRTLPLRRAWYRFLSLKLAWSYDTITEIYLE
jgi:hypothetical protein